MKKRFLSVLLSFTLVLTMVVVGFGAGGFGVSAVDASSGQSSLTGVTLSGSKVTGNFSIYGWLASIDVYQGNDTTGTKVGSYSNPVGDYTTSGPFSITLSDGGRNTDGYTVNMTNTSGSESVTLHLDYTGGGDEPGGDEPGGDVEYAGTYSTFEVSYNDGTITGHFSATYPVYTITVYGGNQLSAGKGASGTVYANDNATHNGYIPFDINLTLNSGYESESGFTIVLVNTYGLDWAGAYIPGAAAPAVDATSINIVRNGANVEGTTVNATVGDTVTFTAKVNPDDAKQGYTFSSNNPAVTIDNANGTATVNTAAAATGIVITATSEDEKVTSSVTVNVSAPVAVTGIDLWIANYDDQTDKTPILSDEYTFSANDDGIYLIGATVKYVDQTTDNNYTFFVPVGNDWISSDDDGAWVNPINKRDGDSDSVNITFYAGEKTKTLTVKVVSNEGTLENQEIFLESGEALTIPVLEGQTGLTLAGVDDSANGLTNIVDSELGTAAFATSAEFKYGTASVSGGNVIYTPNKFVDDIETFYYAAKGSSFAGAAKVEIIPAASVYYEDSFEGITYSDGWSTISDDNSSGKSVHVVGIAFETDYTIYQYLSGTTGDPDINSNSFLRMKSATTKQKEILDQVGTGESTAEFTFFGTGFDVICHTTNDSGRIKAIVDENEEASYWCDNLYADGSLYQLPVISVRNLTAGEHKVTLSATANDFDMFYALGNKVYIDGIRIYTASNAAKERYDSKVKDAKVYSIPEMVLTGLGKASGKHAVNYMPDDFRTESKFRTNDQENKNVEDYLKVGPQNELYVTDGDEIKFVYNFTGDSNLNILRLESKLTTGGTFKITATNERTKAKAENTVNALAAKYYDFDAALEGVQSGDKIIIKISGSDSMLSLSNAMLNDGTTLAVVPPTYGFDTTDQAVNNLDDSIVITATKTDVNGESVAFEDGEITVTPAGLPTGLVEINGGEITVDPSKVTADTTAITITAGTATLTVTINKVTFELDNPKTSFGYGEWFEQQISFPTVVCSDTTKDNFDVIWSLTNGITGYVTDGIESFNAATAGTYTVYAYVYAPDSAIDAPYVVLPYTFTCIDKVKMTSFAINKDGVQTTIEVPATNPVVTLPTTTTVLSDGSSNYTVTWEVVSGNAELNNNGTFTVTGEGGAIELKATSVINGDATETMSDTITYNVTVAHTYDYTFYVDGVEAESPMNVESVGGKLVISATLSVDGGTAEAVALDAEANISADGLIGINDGVVTVDPYKVKQNTVVTVMVADDTTKTFVINITYRPVTLTITGDTEVAVDKTITLSASIDPVVDPATVTWSSSDDTKATVDANGVVTGMGEGPVTITATSDFDPELTATYDITVTAASAYDDPATLKVNSDAVYYFSETNPTAASTYNTAANGTHTLTSGTTYYVKISERIDNSDAYEQWSASKEYNAQSIGEYFVVYEGNIYQSTGWYNQGGVPGVHEYWKLIGPATIEAKIGDALGSTDGVAALTYDDTTGQLTITPAGAYKIGWSIANEYFTLEKGTGSGNVQGWPEQKVTGVSISGANKVGIDKTITLTATVSVDPVDSTLSKAVTWSSSSDAIATVVNGVVTGHAEGEVIITATSVADPTKSGTYTVSVEANAVEVTEVIISGDGTVKVGNTITLTATVKTNPDGADVDGVTWSASNGNATVSANGVVTGVAAGTVEITATSKLDGGVKATKTITVEKGIVVDRPFDWQQWTAGMICSYNGHAYECLKTGWMGAQPQGVGYDNDWWKYLGPID